MATNPMQRRARNSFLLGMLITTVILGIIIAGLVYLMMNMQNENKELQASTVYIMGKDVKSGDEISAADLTAMKVSKNVTPTNAVSPANLGEKNVAKIDLKRGTVVTADMLYIDATSTGNDVRKQQYNMVVLPMDLVTGDYIDVRLIMPSGQDFIVVSKKKVEIPMVGGIDSTTTMNIELAEDETLAMSNAIVEAYMINGAKLYATKYTDPGNQEAATPTYPINAEVLDLLRSNKNILEEARNALASRYSVGLRNDHINSVLSREEDALENEQDKMQESITNSQNEREEYLQSLGGATAAQ